MVLDLGVERKRVVAHHQDDHFHAFKQACLVHVRVHSGKIGRNSLGDLGHERFLEEKREVEHPLRQLQTGAVQRPSLHRLKQRSGGFGALVARKTRVAVVADLLGEGFAHAAVGGTRKQSHHLVLGGRHQRLVPKGQEFRVNIREFLLLELGLQYHKLVEQRDVRDVRQDGLLPHSRRLTVVPGPTSSTLHALAKSTP
jgi:hypothetical protein